MPIVDESIVSLAIRDWMEKVPVGVANPGLPVVTPTVLTAVSPSYAVAVWLDRLMSIHGPLCACAVDAMPRSGPAARTNAISRWRQVMPKSPPEDLSVGFHRRVLGLELP